MWRFKPLPENHKKAQRPQRKIMGRKLAALKLEQAGLQSAINVYIVRQG